MTREFIPCTMERSIGNGVWFRPIKSWHSGTYAGERLYTIPETQDGSGCLLSWTDHSRQICSPPYSVTHRLYWHEREKGKAVSAFLSYPNGLGAYDKYFWEIYPSAEGDIMRFYGEKAEEEMEEEIRKFFRAGEVRPVGMAHF